MKIGLIILIVLITIATISNQGCTSDFDIISCREQIVAINHEYDLKLEALEKTIIGKPSKEVYKQYLRDRQALIDERTQKINDLECIKAQNKNGTTKSNCIYLFKRKRFAN